MVRYPQEKTPQPSKLPVEPVIPKVVEPVPLKVIKEIIHQDAPQEQVEELQLRLHSLEEKLKSIQQKPDGVSKVYKIFLGAGAVLGVLMLCVWAFTSHRYVATIGLGIQPKEFNLPGEKSKDPVGDFKMVPESSNFMSQSFRLYRLRVSTGSDGRSLEARIFSLSPSKAGQFAENWEKSYCQQYMNYRKRSLKDRLSALDRQYAQMREDYYRALGDLN